jgi:hypothetical protein
MPQQEQQQYYQGNMQGSPIQSPQVMISYLNNDKLAHN